MVRACGGSISIFLAYPSERLQFVACSALGLKHKLAQRIGLQNLSFAIRSVKANLLEFAGQPNDGFVAELGGYSGGRWMDQFKGVRVKSRMVIPLM